ncbi:MAG: alpha/beta fold hydrolase [Mycobacterium sp.]
MSDNKSGRGFGRRNAGWLAGAAGLAAVGAVAGTTVARSVGRRVVVEDPYAGEDFEVLDADRGGVVTTHDGVDLAVREVGPADAPLTVVFCHGFCLQMGSFHFQRIRLAEQWGPQVRMVFYDQRGHGRSSEAASESYTVSQLADDLDTVLAVMAPRGPVVLVGHSMGGMTVLAHARSYPDRYRKRIVGVALIASAAEGISETPIGQTLKNPALNAARSLAHYAPAVIRRGRGAARSILHPILQAASFGDEKVSPTVVAYSEKMMHDTPVGALVGFLRALELHDETAALPVLAAVPTLIVCGEQDLLTPPESSERMAAELPDSELVLVDGAGHLVQLEQPEIVNDALVRLVDRAMPSKLVALTRRFRQRTKPRG